MDINEDLVLAERLTSAVSWRFKFRTDGQDGLGLGIF